MADAKISQRLFIHRFKWLLNDCIHEIGIKQDKFVL